MVQCTRTSTMRDAFRNLTTTDGHERPWYIRPDPDNLIVSPLKVRAQLKLRIVGVKRRARGGRVPGSGQGTRSRCSDAGLLRAPSLRS